MELLLAPLTAFAAVMLLVITVLPGQRVDARDRVATFTGRAQTVDLQGSFARRVLVPALESIGKHASSVATGPALNEMRTLIDRAGSPTSLEVLLALRVAGGLVFAGAYLLLSSGGDVAAPKLLLLTAAFAWLGSYLPKLWLSHMATNRQRAIQRSLPDALDLIVVSMEAGLSLDSAFSKVVDRTEGPLARELQRTLREMQLGKSRRDALRDLAGRCDVKDVTTLVNGIVQADQMGVSMAELLRTQADESRVIRRQRAEEKAHQASVKMVIPLILFILPSLLIVAVGPAALTIYRTLITGGVFK